jgi:hypothetical protein
MPPLAGYSDSMMTQLSAPLSDSLFDRLVQLPGLLNTVDQTIDALGMPTWALVLVVILALVSLIFASREFMGWFLKTNAIADEVLRVEGLVRDLQTELKALEEMVAKTKGLATSELPAASTPPHLTYSETELEPSTEKTLAASTPQFPLHH